jgi:hypothetical protein
MSRPRFLILLLWVCATVAGLWSCVGLQPVAGGTSETTNGFVAVVHDPNGNAVSHALVRMRPDGYLSDTGSTGIPYNHPSVVDTFTDTAGRFRISDIDTGKYAIEIQDGMGGASLIQSSALKDSIVDCGVVVVRPVGSIYGFVDRAAVAGSVSVYVRVSGLERLVLADPVTGIFTVSSMPQENYTVCFITSLSSYAEKTVSTSVTSGNATDIGKVVLFPYSGWGYSRTIGLNTTATGAGVSENVFGFPVLIRLADTTFVFSQVKTGGADIRFMKPDSTPLPYEIEQWDAANGKAGLWVRLDTVYGGNNTQSIVMYWGNPGAAVASNSAAVFDTTNGFQGVWHLAEAGNATAFDATGNHYDGTPTGMNTASAVSGVIGTAQDFNGSSSCITMANTANSTLNFPQSGNYSLSLWAYVDTLDANWHEIAGKGHEQYYVKFKSLGNSRAIWEFVEFQDQQGWEYAEDSVPPSPGSKQWVHVTGVREGSLQSLYINGAPVSSTILLKAGSYSRNTSDDFMIGRYARQVLIPLYEGWCYFDGKVDEVRVSSGAQSADWIRLSYMNQRADDKLVAFK